ncbi:NCS1 nucleoside transporter [Niveomyces insectorum RCEF 264]|uniref:NCS1 nucleoside transporter n=1 Tax=Niveomyces insectorum RCEF 264 TaxID=1081102 RepID=A0A167RXN7_9HYPO|nr:NCS1 nucleoside transporter [Niveomyces insectorum RCEF 264]
MLDKSRLRAFGRKAKLAVTTKEGFKHAIEVQTSDFAPSSHGFIWSNAHMDPSPPSERTWTWVHYFSVWYSYNFTSGAWAAAASLLSLNVNWWQAILACVVGSMISGLAVSLNSRQSSVYHIGFPTLQRVSFGLYGSLFPVFTRAVVSVLWIGVTVYQSSLFLDIAFRCVFGNAWYNMPNTFPASSTITTRKFVACFILWICSYPAMFLKIHRMRHFWTIKALIIPPITIGFFIYCMVIGHKGAVSYAGTPHPARGAQLGWAFMYSVQAIIGSFSPMIASNPDIARYANKPHATGWSQFLTITLWKSVVCILGIFGTNAYAYRYGVTYWNLWDMCNDVLTHNWTGGVRFAIFLFSALMACSEQIKNLSANMISFGADSASLLPKYININRGMVLGLTIGFVIQPWHILATAKAYLTFLTGYSLFMGAIPAIAIADYVLRKGNVDVLSLYTAGKDYWYFKGWNWKAYAAYLMAVWPVCPGLAYQFNKSPSTSQGWVHLYQIGWLFAVAMGAFTYVALSYVFKDSAMCEAHRHPWESYAQNQRDLLDKEPADNAVLVGSPSGESESEHAPDLSEKGSKSPVDVVTAV